MRKEWNVNVNFEENGLQEVCLLLDWSHSHLGTEKKDKETLLQKRIRSLLLFETHQ